MQSGEHRLGTAGGPGALGERIGRAWSVGCRPDGAPSGRPETPRSGPTPSGAAAFPRASTNRRGRPQRLDTGALSSRAPQAPASVPGGVQRPQRLAGELVRAEEEHPPGRLLADSGAPAILPARGPAEPSQRSPLGSRSPARAATSWQVSPAAPHQNPHRLRPRPTLRRRVRGRVRELGPRGGAREETRWAGSVWLKE